MIGLGRGLGVLSDVFVFAACVGLILMMVHITFDVFMRLIGSPIPATITIVPFYYMVPLIFLPLAMAERNDAQITVELLTQKLGQRWQQVLAVFGWLLAIAIYLVMTLETWGDASKKLAIGAFKIEQGVKIPIWMSYYVLPIGFGLAMAVLIYRVLIMVTGAKSGLGEAQHDAFHDNLAD